MHRNIVEVPYPNFLAPFQKGQVIDVGVAVDIRPARLPHYAEVPVALDAEGATRCWRKFITRPCQRERHLHRCPNVTIERAHDLQVAIGCPATIDCYGLSGNEGRPLRGNERRQLRDFGRVCEPS